MPLKPAVGVRGTVAGHRVGALEGGGGVPPLPMHRCAPLHRRTPAPSPAIRSFGRPVVRGGRHETGLRSRGRAQDQTPWPHGPFPDTTAQAPGTGGGGGLRLLCPARWAWDAGVAAAALLPPAHPPPPGRRSDGPRGASRGGPPPPPAAPAPPGGGGGGTEAKGSPALPVPRFRPAGGTGGGGTPSPPPPGPVGGGDGAGPALGRVERTPPPPAPAPAPV